MKPADPRFLLLFACLTAVSLSGTVAVAQEQGDDPLTQEELDELTAAIKADIEELRGVEFPRDVPCSVADPDTFRKYAFEQLEKVSSKEEVAAEGSVMKLLGLIPADMDLLEAQLGVLEEQAAGFYDPTSEGFYIMPTIRGDIARITLAHELTHALDDQLFDIDGTKEKLIGNGDAQWAYHAVVEGSGTAVMNQWTIRHFAELDMGELTEAEEMSRAGLDDVPSYLWKPAIGTYMRGSAFLVRSTSVLQGTMSAPERDDLRRAFTEPPLSSEQVLHPEKYWDEEERDDPIAVEIDGERLPEGWEVLHEDTLGEFALALVVEDLKKRDRGLPSSAMALMGMKYTSKAADGWGGDRFVLLGKDDARLLHLATVWDGEGDAEEFHEALRDLADHMTGSVRAYAEHVEVGQPGRSLVREKDRVFLTLGFGAEPELYVASSSWARFAE